MKLGLHQHYKGGIYSVIHLAANANSHEMERGALTVVYQCEKLGQVYTRDYAEFAASAPGTEPGQRNPRFKYVAEDPSIATHKRPGGTDQPDLLYRERPDGDFDFFSPRAVAWVRASFTRQQLFDEMGLKAIEEA